MVRYNQIALLNIAIFDALVTFIGLRHSNKEAINAQTHKDTRRQDIFTLIEVNTITELVKDPIKNFDFVIIDDDIDDMMQVQFAKYFEKWIE